MGGNRSGPPGVAAAPVRASLQGLPPRPVGPSRHSPNVPPPTENRRSRDWYKISVDSLRGCATLVLLLAVAVVAYAGFRIVRPRLERWEASLAISEAQSLLGKVHAVGVTPSYQSGYDSAVEGLERAEADFAARHYRSAVAAARTSRALLASVLDAALSGRPVGDVQFILVQGGVEFRRGDSARWQRADSRLALAPGDYVKTGDDGVAEIMFSDGSLYTVRPDTLFVVRRSPSSGSGGEQAISMEYGWVDLSTSHTPSRVSTPDAEATVAERSEALVTFDQEASVGRFTAFRGALEVSSERGEHRRIGELQEVVMEDATLSAPHPLPPAPELLAPGDDLAVDLGEQDRLVLRWTPVAGARSYALQVSRTRLFVDNVIDVDERASSRATLGLRGTGSFLWRVAARDAEGRRGPWSEHLRFRVTEPAPVAATDRRLPAALPGGPEPTAGGTTAPAPL